MFTRHAGKYFNTGGKSENERDIHVTLVVKKLETSK
jgi:hypothetical protein